MKTKIAIAAVLALAGGKLFAQTQANLPDSIRIHVVENKNGNLLDIDTIVPLSQQQELFSWLHDQGIEVPPPPPPGDSNLVIRMEKMEIDNDSMTPVNARRMHGPPAAPVPPLPPLPPMPPDSLGHVRVVRMQKFSGDSMVILVPPPGKAGARTMPFPGDSTHIICSMIICDSLRHPPVPGHPGAGQFIIVAPGTPCPPPPPAKQGQVLPNGKTSAQQTPSQEMMTAYPNPTDGKITLSFDIPGKETANIRITDASGKLVYEEKVADSNEHYTKEIDLSKNGKGIYSIEVKKGGTLLVKKVVVE